MTHRVVLHAVSWDTYQALLADMGEQRASRLTYDQGTLEIIMPSKLHEIVNRLLERIVNVLTEELNLSVIALGSTTVERVELQRGVEPDSSFYITKAAQVDPAAPTVSIDLPLDLVIEVDITSSSSHRLAVYQALQIVEVWRYTSQTIHILHLQHGTYVPCTRSPTFPMLSTTLLWDLVEQGRLSQDYNTVNRAVRACVRAWQQQATYPADPQESSGHA
jgi:Uma2 family endonuclease